MLPMRSLSIDMLDCLKRFWVYLACWGISYWIWLLWLPKDITGSQKYLTKFLFVFDRCGNHGYVHNGLLATLLDEHLAFVVCTS